MTASIGNGYLEQADIEVLLQLVRAGDSTAFPELMRRYEGMVRRRSHSILKDAEEAEDATQETFLRVYSKLETFKGESAFTTWLTRIAINVCLMQLRRRRNKPVTSLEELIEGDASAFLLLMDTAPNPEQQYNLLDLKSRLDKAIYRLPLKLRDIVSDQIYEEESIRQLAEKRGISFAAAKSRLFRARKRLQSAFPDLMAQPKPSRRVASRTVFYN